MTRRLFFALWPDAGQRAALAQASAKAVRFCGGRPVPAESLHVTLAFLGSVAETRLAELSAIARRIAAGYPAAALPVEVRLERLVHWAKPQLLCAVSAADLEAPPEAPGCPGAAALAAALKGETAAAGFTPDLKPFRAHVTLARKVRNAGAAQPLAALRWCCESFALIDSRTEPSGPIYSVVESYPLFKPQKARE